MKLETHMSDATGKWIPCVTWGDPPGYCLNHDAAAAHALMQAMGEFEDERDAEYTGDPMIRLMKRADSLLREWGFDSGEVAE